MKELRTIISHCFNTIFGIAKQFKMNLETHNSKKAVCNKHVAHFVCFNRLSINNKLKISYITAAMLLVSVNFAWAQNITVSNGQTLTISVNTTYSSLTVNNGGTLIIQAPATLTVGAVGTSASTQVVDFQNGSTVNVNAGAFMVVNGMMNNSNNSDQVTIDGDVYVNGNYQGGQKSAVIGSGTFNSSGQMTTSGSNASNNGLIFGSATDCNTGPCSGNNLACSLANTISTANQSICAGSSASTLNGSTLASTTYQWQSSATGSSFTNISGATNEDYSPGVVSTTIYYRRSATKSACTNYSPQKVVIVTPTVTPSVSISSSATTICSGASITITATPTNGGTPTYQWKKGGVTISGATNSTYTTTTAANNDSYTVTMTSTATCSSPTTATSSAVVITVNTKSTVPTSSTGTTSICSGSSAPVTVTGGSLGTGAVAVWYENSCPAFTEDWGGTSSSYTTHGTTVNSVSGGVMNVTVQQGTGPSNPTDPWIEMFNTGLYNPATYKYIKVRYRINSGNPGNIQIYFIKNTPASLTFANENAVVVSPALIADGNWNIVTIDMSQSANWAGNSVTGWRFDYATDVGNMDIDYITLTPAAVSSPVSPSSTTSYYVRYEGLCNSTVCPGTPATITVKPTPTITATTPASRCGTGSISLGATPSAGTVNWYTGSTGGSSVGTGTSYSTTISATTTFYVDATNNSCTTSSRTAVVATVNSCTITWTGATSTDWATTSNWSSLSIPTTIDDVIIPSSVTSNRMPTIVASTDVRSLTNSGTLTISSAGTLNAYGDITNNGTLTTVAGSTVAFKGSTAQSMTGVSTLYNVVINNTGGVALQSALAVNGTLSLTKGVLTTNSNLTINFDNGGNIGYTSGDLGSISGTVTGKRSLVAKTHYIGVPFNGVTSSQVAATTPLYLNSYWKLYSRTFATQNWLAITDLSTAMPVGTGFSLALPAAAALIFTGTYDHTLSFTTPSYTNIATGKYLFVGNPYPSTLDWDNASGWTKTNVGGAVYYWDAPNNRTASYVAGIGTNGGTRYIPAMQGVLVALTGSGGNSSISINNNARIATQNPAYMRTASEVVVRIRIEDSTAVKNDETVIRFNEGATNEFDPELDAYKIMNSSLMPSLYTTSGTDIYSINSYAPVDSVKSIPVATKLPADGKYTLTITNNDPAFEYVLIDKKLGLERTIKEPYKFEGLKADDVNRFELQLRVSETPTEQTESKAGSLEINSSAQGGFYIQTQRYAGAAAEIQIIDIAGKSREVLSVETLSAGATFIPLDLPAGSYLVKVRAASDNFSGMIVLVK